MKLQTTRRQLQPLSLHVSLTLLQQTHWDDSNCSRFQVTQVLNLNLGSLSICYVLRQDQHCTSTSGSPWYHLSTKTTPLQFTPTPSTSFKNLSKSGKYDEFHNMTEPHKKRREKKNDTKEKQTNTKWANKSGKWGNCTCIIILV